MRGVTESKHRRWHKQAIVKASDRCPVWRKGRRMVKPSRDLSQFCHTFTYGKIFRVDRRSEQLDLCFSAENGSPFFRN